MDTAGYGGRRLEKSVEVMTNDSKAPVVHLTIAGAVDRFATISPRMLSLRGTSGLTRSKSVKGTRAVVTVPTSTAGRLVVRAMRGPGDEGRTARGRFKARAKVASDFRTFRELRRVLG